MCVREGQRDGPRGQGGGRLVKSLTPKKVAHAFHLPSLHTIALAVFCAPFAIPKPALSFASVFADARPALHIT